MNRDDNMQLSL